MEKRLDYVDRFEKVDKALTGNYMSVKDLLGAIPLTDEEYEKCKESLRLARERLSEDLEARERKLAKYWEQRD